MPSQAKIDSARTNGAKSHGPKTDAGRKKSSQNAIAHGFYAKAVVLPTEPRGRYQKMLNAYLDQFHPESPAEHDLVEEMVAAKWRQRRLWAIEADLLGIEMLDQQPEVEATYSSYDAITPISLAYAALAKSTSLPFLTRNESRLERAYNRALKTLLDLQSQNKKCRNEPNHPRETAPTEQRETRNEKRETENQKPETRYRPVDVTSRNPLA